MHMIPSSFFTFPHVLLFFALKGQCHVVDTGDKFATGVVDTGTALWLANISANKKKFETVLMGYSGAGGKLIHYKTEAKNLVTLSL